MSGASLQSRSKTSSISTLLTVASDLDVAGRRFWSAPSLRAFAEKFSYGKEGAATWACAEVSLPQQTPSRLRKVTALSERPVKMLASAAWDS